MAGICAGRVVIVTGAGRGLGRAHALEFARQGARLVVNDVGAAVDGSGASAAVAEQVAEEVRAIGAEAVASQEDVSDWDGALRLIDSAVDAFGGLDVLVNNAGILRDRMLVNMSAEEWDAVMRVHLRGTFATSHWAAVYWRDRSKSGQANDARVINTSSASGLYGNIGQTNYGAAKAGIAAFSVIAAAELGRYGVTVNAISPAALTRMTENLNIGRRAAAEAPDGFDAYAPENVSPLVVWLGSAESAGVTGQVFAIAGGRISVMEGWHPGPTRDRGGRWDAAELGPVVAELVAAAARPYRELGSVGREADGGATRSSLST